MLGRDGLAIAVGGAGEVAAFDVATGERVWHYQEAPTADHAWARHDPVLAGDLLLVPGAEGVVLALDARTGGQRWRASLGSPVATSVAATAEAAWVGTVDGRLRKLDLASGATVATLDAGGRPFGDLQLTADCLLVLTMAKGHALDCRDPVSGDSRWRWAVEPEISTFRPLVLADTVVAGDDQGRLYGLALGDGQERWRCALPHAPRGLSAAAGRLFVGMLPGTVWALPQAACREPR